MQRQIKNAKLARREKIRRRIRAVIRGSASRPRLCVRKTNCAFYAQLVDDASGQTLVAADSRKLGGKALHHVEKLAEVFAGAAKAKGIDSIVFDRSGYLHHGAVKTFFDGVRRFGLN